MPRARCSTCFLRRTFPGYSSANRLFASRIPMSCFVKLETGDFLIFITCEVIEVIQSIRNLNRSSIQKRAGEQLKDKKKNSQCKRKRIRIWKRQK